MKGNVKKAAKHIRKAIKGAISGKKKRKKVKHLIKAYAVDIARKMYQDTYDDEDLTDFNPEETDLDYDRDVFQIEQPPLVWKEDMEIKS